MNEPQIRVASAADASAVAAIYAPFVEGSWVSFEERAPDAAEMARRIAAAGGRFPFLVAEIDGEFAGYAYAGEHRAREAYRWSVDASVYLDERFRRHGAASRLYRALFAVLAAQRFVSVFAGIALPNDASVGFHRSMGFRDVGVYPGAGFKAGAWHDTLWLGRPLRARESPPREPLRLDELAPGEVVNLLANNQGA